jgi:trehalose synthase
MKQEGIISTIDQYEQHVGAEAVDRIRRKAKDLFGERVAHVNSTYYGGGVAEILDPLSLLMNDLDIPTEWLLIQGEPDFFANTKKMHNALQGGEIQFTELKTFIYEEVLKKNALRMHLDTFDRVVIHDPQPLFLIDHFRKTCPWVWRCHIDLSRPHQDLWNYLKPVIEKYDAMIVSSRLYQQEVTVPQRIFMPAINPFSIKNKELTQEEIDERLDHYEIPTDLPLVVQISRFDTWKDPRGVIEAFKKARRKVDATLVLLGNIASDDPEGPEIYESLLEQREERIILISKEDTALVNALQRSAAVVLQKSIREGFGLTVTEAMWKGVPVIGGNAGGIPLQINDGENGFLVSNVDEAAERIVTLLEDKKRRDVMGQKARQTVLDNFLMTRLLEQYIDLLRSFEVEFHLRKG